MGSAIHHDLRTLYVAFSGYSHAVVNSSLPNKNDIQNKLNTLNKKAIRVLKINWLLQILKSRWVFMMS